MGVMEVGHWLFWMEWRLAGWWVCLPLLILPCTIKSRSSLLAPAHPDGPGKRAMKRLWCGGGGIMHNIKSILYSDRIRSVYCRDSMFIHMHILVILLGVLWLPLRYSVWQQSMFLLLICGYVEISGTQRPLALRKF